MMTPEMIELIDRLKRGWDISTKKGIDVYLTQKDFGTLIKVIDYLQAENERLRKFIVDKDLGMEFILTKMYKGKNDDTL